ncbi:predicted protein [Thalassiosira pseudonana CCMP1335]|uniref:Phosphoglycerate mutase n=1 Tax=Thalassiosira pseudonana TaxID=35128 RepID=B8LDE8_THAPS|nr:predicted protein [Thalassiosira pseudonana CCMP1335]EED86696.1 predicted protein [Thalassiosira pseudonana CCMP1335]
MASKHHQRTTNSIHTIILCISLFHLPSSTAMSTGKTINHLLQRTSPLTQSYYALRHGQSLANVAKIISSDPNISTVQHGLSDVGKEQARLAGELFASDHNNNNHRQHHGVAIFTSDFARARETASIFANELTKRDIPLYNGDINLETILRERYFGTLNGGSDTRYQDVWDVDVVDPNHNEFQVESANSVLQRTTKLINTLDERLRQQSFGDNADSNNDDDDSESSWKVVLVAHGDVLQILQTGFLRHDDASRHRSLQHLETATIRELMLLG